MTPHEASGAKRASVPFPREELEALMDENPLAFLGLIALSPLGSPGRDALIALLTPVPATE